MKAIDIKETKTGVIFTVKLSRAAMQELVSWLRLTYREAVDSCNPEKPQQAELTKAIYQAFDDAW